MCNDYYNAERPWPVDLWQVRETWPRPRRYAMVYTLSLFLCRHWWMTRYSAGIAFTSHKISKMIEHGQIDWIAQYLTERERGEGIIVSRAILAFALIPYISKSCPVLHIDPNHSHAEFSGQHFSFALLTGGFFLPTLLHSLLTRHRSVAKSV